MAAFSFPLCCHVGMWDGDGDGDVACCSMAPTWRLTCVRVFK